MAYSINNINEAVDNKFLVTKNLSNQAQSGTLIHVMGGDESMGRVNVKYRVTGSGQDFNVSFNSIKEFCKWARPDTFIARYYENFDAKEIHNYIKINDRTIMTFCLPLIAAALAVIWIGAIILVNAAGATPAAAYIIAAVLSIAAIVAIILMYRGMKTKVKLKLYKKVSSNWAGGGIKF